ncbi:MULTISPECIES: LacI family DNA-binding transcriptional regulator [Galbibacter]|uniref:LacI family DNA-binding transcriptional regulator n=1 Tax=Galbibacter pacificus TaxID=2996052 RepID=A0ABT6FWB8_9FLAO|nr:LacI family DNA-binding transcriptional regulator [Galbibacter pacificus]MDG3583997.1 LacI family DNA-binding transcriptional regulator [Galbibacter pacificus]MDG3587566.1 LacI family DNA-binding transcriptional regulator [Galbibacter pacificus]
MKKKITMKEIARELDVSISTVSKALNNSSEISQDTIDKVQAFAKLYNYKPNNIALSLKNKKTKNIAVIIPEIVHHFFTMIISGIEHKANELGYNVIVCLSNESFAKEVINMETMANGSIDGFLLSLSKETLLKKDFHHLREVINQGMPLVMFDRISDEIYCDKVIIDDARASYNTVKHLVYSGCNRIALLTTPDYVSVGKLRTSGYINALMDEGIEIDEKLIVKIDKIEELEEKVKVLFDTQTFDAVFGVNELYAVVAMREAHNRGFKIPQQMSFVGFSDGILSKYAYPTLTTVVQHGYEMGQKAAKMLIDRLENEDDDGSYKTDVIKTSILQRESTKPI